MVQELHIGLLDNTDTGVYKVKSIKLFIYEI